MSELPAGVIADTNHVVWLKGQAVVPLDAHDFVTPANKYAVDSFAVAQGHTDSMNAHPELWKGQHLFCDVVR